jgi:hypothetical protein
MLYCNVLSYNFISHFQFSSLSLRFGNETQPSVRNDPEHISLNATADVGFLPFYYPGYRSFVA